MRIRRGQIWRNSATEERVFAWGLSATYSVVVGQLGAGDQPSTGELTTLSRPDES